MIVRKILFIVAIISALGISTIAAEEAEPTAPLESHDSHQGMIREQEEVVVDHSEMSQTEHESENIEHEGEQTEHQGEQAGHESEQTEQTEQGHHKEVVETPPNFMVLGSFAVVNLLFIMIGVWMKWFQKKGATA